MPCDRAQMEMFSYWGKVNGKRGEERGKTSLLGQEWQKRRKEKRKRKRDRGEEREMGDGLDAFRREHRECPQEVLLAATAEDVYPKVRPLQMPKWHLKMAILTFSTSIISDI